MDTMGCVPEHRWRRISIYVTGRLRAFWLPLVVLLRPLERHLWRPFAELQLGGYRAYPVLFYLSLVWTVACIAVLEVRDILRSSSVSLDSRAPLLSSADSSRGRGADSMGASTVAHDGTRQARGAMGGGLGGSGDAMGSRGGAENINLHFSEGATHEIPEWVLEPASGQGGSMVVGIDPMQEVKDCLVKEGLGLHECTAKFASDEPASGADGLKSMLARAKTVPHDSLGKSSSGNKLEATEESSRGQQLPALQELSATQDAQEPAPKTQSPPVRPVPPYGGGHVAAGGKVPVVYPPARGHGDSPGIPGRQPWDGGGSGGCGNGVDSDSWARLLAGQRSLLRVLAQAQRAGKAPCWAIEKRALKVAFPNGTGSAAGKQADRTPRATVSPLSNANTSDNQSPPARGHGKEVGEAGEGLQDDSYQMLRDGFSKHGEDALVLQMLLHDRVIGGMDEAAVGDGEGEMEGPVRPGGGSFGMKPGDRGAFVEIGLPFDGLVPSHSLMLEWCYKWKGVCIDPLALPDTPMARALHELRPSCQLVAKAITQKESPQSMWAVRGTKAGLSVIPSSVGSAALDTLLACDLAHVRPRIIVVEADMCEPQDRAAIRSFLQRDGYELEHVLASTLIFARKDRTHSRPQTKER